MEQKVNRDLQRLGFNTLYLFITEWVRTAQKSRSRLSRRSFFPRYLFAQGGRGDLHTIKDTTGVQYVCGTGGEPVPVPDQAIDRLERLALPTGEVLIGKRRRTKYMRGDRVQVADETSALFGLNLLLTWVDNNAIIGDLEQTANMRVKLPLDAVRKLDD